MRFYFIPLFIFLTHFTFGQEASDSLRLSKTKFVVKSTAKIDSLNSSLNK